jgi:predicted RNase H-like nuclease
MDVKIRPAYKVAKIARYFRKADPPLSRDQRIDCLLQTWTTILAAVDREISVLPFKPPHRSTLKFASELKAYEDQLDAIISAFVGACVLEGRAEAFGNDDSAIWVPTKTSTQTGPIR